MFAQLPLGVTAKCAVCRLGIALVQINGRTFAVEPFSIRMDPPEGTAGPSFITLETHVCPGQVGPGKVV
jgi:hypothetical protein